MHKKGSPEKRASEILSIGIIHENGHLSIKKHFN